MKTVHEICEKIKARIWELMAKKQLGTWIIFRFETSLPVSLCKMRTLRSREWSFENTRSPVVAEIEAVCHRAADTIPRTVVEVGYDETRQSLSVRLTAGNQ